MTTIHKGLLKSVSSYALKIFLQVIGYYGLTDKEKTRVPVVELPSARRGRRDLLSGVTLPLFFELTVHIFWREIQV